MTPVANVDDNRPFPIQGLYHFVKRAPCTIPWWLAEEAYTEYVKRHGREQSLECLAERGGFDRYELLELLNGNL